MKPLVVGKVARPGNGGAKVKFNGKRDGVSGDSVKVWCAR